MRREEVAGFGKGPKVLFMIVEGIVMWAHRPPERLLWDPRLWDLCTCSPFTCHLGHLFVPMLCLSAYTHAKTSFVFFQ